MFALFGHLEPELIEKNMVLKPNFNVIGSDFTLKSFVFGIRIVFPRVIKI